MMVAKDMLLNVQELRVARGALSGPSCTNLIQQACPKLNLPSYRFYHRVLRCATL